MAKIYGDRWEVKSSLSEGGQAYTFLVIDTKGSREEHYNITSQIFVFLAKYFKLLTVANL